MSLEIANLSMEYPVVLIHGVEFWEMDIAFHVNNVHYLRWFENARVRYLEAIGEMQTALQEGIGLVVGWQECKYISPVSYPDSVHVGVKVTDMQGSKVIMEAKMVSQTQDKVVALAAAHLVAFNFRQKQKIPLSEDFILKVNSFQLKDFYAG